MDNTSRKDLYEEDEIIGLEFDDGETLEVGIMGTFDVNGIPYIALEDLRDGSDDVYLYRYIATEDEFELEDIPDDEFEAVEAEFERLLDTI